MKTSTDICKSLEDFCLKKLKCPVKCKKLKNSCEKELSSGCPGKVGKKQTVKPKTVKPKTVKPKTVKPKTVNPKTVKQTQESGLINGIFNFINPPPQIQETDKEIKTVTKIPEEIIKTVTKIPEVKSGDVTKLITMFEELKPPGKESVKLQEDINAIATKNEITKKEEKYVQKVFKNLNIDYKSCDSLEIYKENLRQKCIKFLGYQSDTKKQEGCIATRFRWLLEANPDLEKSLLNLGCKVPKTKKQ